MSLSLLLAQPELRDAMAWLQQLTQAG